MMLTEIENKINLIEDIRELRQIQQFVKDRKRAIGNRLKYQLQIGDKVKINGSGRLDNGVVTKINRTRAVVKIDNQQWTVPFTMITKEQ